MIKDKKINKLLILWLIDIIAICIFMILIAINNTHKDKQIKNLTMQHELSQQALHDSRTENITLQEQVLQLQQFDFHTVMACLLDESSKQKIPLNISLALAGIESGFDPGAISPTGDYGLFQINERAWPFDKHEILKPTYNIPLGLSILRHYYDKAGNWPLATAMYNMGKRHALSNHPKKLLELGGTNER